MNYGKYGMIVFTTCVSWTLTHSLMWINHQRSVFRRQRRRIRRIIWSLVPINVVTSTPLLCWWIASLRWSWRLRLKRIASRLATKWKQPYSQACWYVKIRVAITLVRANHCCIRGSGVRVSKIIITQPQWEDRSGLHLFYWSNHRNNNKNILLYLLQDAISEKWITQVLFLKIYSGKKFTTIKTETNNIYTTLIYFSSEVPEGFTILSPAQLI